MIARLVLSFSVAAALFAQAETVRAAPPSLAVACAAHYQVQATALATVNSLVYPFQWVQQSLSRTSVTLDLQIFYAAGTKTFSGWVCTVDADGQITGTHS